MAFEPIDILGIDQFVQIVGVDYSNLDDNTPSTEYGRIVYRGVTVTSKATGNVTRFESGDFKADYSAARDFVFEQSRGKVNQGYIAYCVMPDPSLDKFIEVNTKYAFNYR